MLFRRRRLRGACACVRLRACGCAPYCFKGKGKVIYSQLTTHARRDGVCVPARRLYIYISQLKDGGAACRLCYISAPSQLIALAPATSPRHHKKIHYANDSLLATLRGSVYSRAPILLNTHFQESDSKRAQFLDILRTCVQVHVGTCYDTSGIISVASPGYRS